MRSYNTWSNIQNQMLALFSILVDGVISLNKWVYREI